MLTQVPTHTHADDTEQGVTAHTPGSWLVYMGGPPPTCCTQNPRTPQDDAASSHSPPNRPPMCCRQVQRRVRGKTQLCNLAQSQSQSQSQAARQQSRPYKQTELSSVESETTGVKGHICCCWSAGGSNRVRAPHADHHTNEARQQWHTQWWWIMHQQTSGNTRPVADQPTQPGNSSAGQTAPHHTPCHTSTPARCVTVCM